MFSAECHIQPIVLKFRNVARKAFASFSAGQDSKPSEQEQEQLSLLAGNSLLVINKTKSTENSPNDSTDSDVITPPDLQATLQEHFRNMEWEQRKYDQLNNQSTAFQTSQLDGQNINNLDLLSSLNLPLGGNNLDMSTFDLGIFDTLPGLAPGQLPMPLDGVNYNFNVQQEQQSEDPLDFLSIQNPTVASGQSWDYEA